MVNITGRPALLTTFPFGKYRGKAVSEVAKRDPGYLRWLFNNLDNMSPELRLTLKHYLEDVQADEQRSNGTPQYPRRSQAVAGARVYALCKVPCARPIKKANSSATPS